VPPEEALVLLGPVKVLVAAYFRIAPSSDATNFEPAPFERALAEANDADGFDDYEEGETSFAFDAVHTYLEFLGETSTWTGTEEGFNAVDDLFHIDEEGLLPDIVAPNLTPEEELAGLEATGLAQRMEALLRWIGASKPVTSTGALRLKEIEGAAAAIGVAAKGAMPNAKREQLPLFDVEAARPGSVPTVKSMHEVPLLAKIWIALDACGLIDIGSTKVWPTPLAEEFLEPGHPGRLEVLRDFTAKFLNVAVLGEESWAPWVTHAAMAQSALLFAACTETPVPADVLTNPAKLQRLNLDEYGARILQRRMDELAELGLVAMGDVIAVPPALVPSVVTVMQSAFRDNDDDVDDPWAAEAKPQPKITMRKAGKAGPLARLLQLKVMIKGSKPPIWRRLQLRSDLTLEQLHHIIQTSFGWQGGHLHEFRVGAWGGAVYGPAEDEDFGFGDPPLDESTVAIGELLEAEKDTVTYTYDFGDNWQHAVTVEKVLPYDDGAPAVCCTGGRGAGPVEDCGGLWGWEELVLAVNDPSHERHGEFREWLMLEPGEVFDLKAFDKDGVDERLRDLY
jgi:hypothetical protein